jgi:hypothetical protein
MKNRIINKIKHKDGVIHIEWHIEGEKGDDKHMLISPDLPSVDFDKALAALLPWALELTDHDEDYGEHMVITGVILSYDVEGTMAATITALKTLKSTKVIPINTPHMPCEVSAAGIPTLPLGCTHDIESLKTEALEYIDRKRLQEDLPNLTKAA